MLSPIRKVLKRFHPEGIPWPGTILYNAVSANKIFQRHYELIARDILRYCTEGRVLDIGTGPGWLLTKLHQASPTLQISGLDVSSSMVSKARKNIRSAGLSEFINVRIGDVSHLPFEDCSFNAVVSTGSIHHWKNPSAGLNEIYRVLKKGGYGLMYDLVSDTPQSVMKEAAIEFGRLRIFLLWLHSYEEPFYSYKNFELLVRNTLFKNVKTRFVGVMFCLILNK